MIAIRPRRRGVAPHTPLAERIGRRIRETLLVNAEVDLVAWESLPRSDYKSKLVDWSRAEG